MSNYIAPIEEMKFVLNEVVGLEDLCKTTQSDSSTVDIIDTILDAAGKLAKEEIEPINKPGDLEGVKINAAGEVSPPKALKKLISIMLKAAGALFSSVLNMEDKECHLWLQQASKKCGIQPICLGAFAPFLLREQLKQFLTTPARSSNSTICLSLYLASGVEQ